MAHHCNLEIFRTSFTHQLTASQPDMSGYQEFLRYWKTVEAEAMHTEDSASSTPGCASWRATRSA
jgi:hypothetical protein